MTNMCDNGSFRTLIMLSTFPASGEKVTIDRFPGQWKLHVEVLPEYLYLIELQTLHKNHSTAILHVYNEFNEKI